jgi:hypothetical protein
MSITWECAVTCENRPQRAPAYDDSLLIFGHLNRMSGQIPSADQRGMLMAKHSKASTRNVKKLGALGFGSFAVAAAFGAVGCGTAGADVNEVGPGPTVVSRQASQNSVIRINDFGVARGISEGLVADAGVVNAFGEVRDTMKAVVGSTASAFEGEYPVGPPIGDW